MEKRLYRSRNDQMLGGVCGGVAEYFNVDPSIVRILCVALFFSGMSLIAYIAAWIILPLQRPLD
mgnify:CR=1 FL=1